ncbi:DNA cytosine methyltransferase [Pleomorphomonas koreensis]|uniref:DNA cytosine methyltransferase n=1 Tax=Pleomorphomonas koreensis TaxID=257440 RepID=UPI0003FE01A7|nr:DNA cytosine methyltransferase [Pleomorphomonas koreensis]
MNAYAFPLDNRLTVVLFAGMGGGCDGLEWAGFPVHIAINHDPIAVAVHEARHPHTRHLRCDVYEVDPREVCAGRDVRVLHASPDCTHFSVAKGGKPVSPRRRSLAWVVCRWGGTVRPETITLENVSEIQTWGPLIAKRDAATGRVVKLDGQIAAKGEVVPVREQWLVPDPRHKGRIWRAWLKHLTGLGYSFEGRVLVCADFGVPTIRKRFFGVAKADGSPIDWPARTHAPRDQARKLGLKPWVGAHTCIDFSLPMRSIFGRKKPLAEATMRRTARGVIRYILGTRKPFLVPITHTKGGNGARSTAEPLPTITTAKGGEQVVMSPVLARFRGDSAGGDMREPAPALTANSFRKRPGGALPIGVMAANLVGVAHGDSGGRREYSLDEPLTAVQAGGGNAALVAAYLAQHNDGPRAGLCARDIVDPLSALTTTGSQQGVVAATLGRMRGADVAGQPVTLPMPTQTAGGGHETLILGFLQHYYSTGGQDGDLADPLAALTAKARHGLVTVEVDGVDYVMTDILCRMLEPEEGAACHGFLPGSLPAEIVVDGKRQRLTKTQKYHLVGNSVPPRMVQLLAERNVRRELVMEAAE